MHPSASPLWSFKNTPRAGEPLDKPDLTQLLPTTPLPHTSCVGGSGGCCEAACCCWGPTSCVSFGAAKNAPILAWRELQFLRTTASVAVSTRSLKGLGFRGDAVRLKGLAGEGAMALRSQPAKGTRGGGQSGTSEPSPYLTALQDLSTSGLTAFVRLALRRRKERKKGAGRWASELGMQLLFEHALLLCGTDRLQL